MQARPETPAPKLRLKIRRAEARELPNGPIGPDSGTIVCGSCGTCQTGSEVTDI